MALIYPEDFKREVLILFNDDPKIKAMLATNNPWIGRYLDDGQPTFSATQVLAALNSESEIQVLREKCHRALRFRTLYNEYWKIRNG